MNLTPSARSTLLRLAPVLVLSATFLAYAAVYLFGFVYDDEGQIVHNLFVQQWRFIPAYFSSHVWQWVFPHAVGNYYRPIFLLWLLLNFKVFGLHPAGWHLAVLALHLVVTWQVWRLCSRLLDNPWAAATAALLFGVHPVHIESVAWISGVTEPLAAIFILASLLTYMAYRSGRERRWLWMTYVWFGLGLLTKETAVLVPALLIAYDAIFPQQDDAQLVKRLTASAVRVAPMAFIFAVYLVLRYHALGALSHNMVNISVAENLLTIPSVLWFYARLLLYPIGLSGFYDLPYVTSVKAALLPAVAVVLAALLLGLALWRTRSRVSSFAAALLVLPLVPLMDLRVFREIVHDRYLYLSTVGFVLLIGVVVRHFSEQRWRSVAYALCGVLAIGYTGATMMQSLNWADNLVLYARGVEIAPNNLIARTDLGNELMKRGDRARAVQQYRVALQTDPSFWLARYNLGFAEYSAGDCTAATRDLELAAQQDPTDAETFFYLGQCVVRLGNRREGIAFMIHGINLEPRMPNFRATLADVLADGGSPDDLREALKLYQAEATANPAHPYAARKADDVRKELDR